MLGEFLVLFFLIFFACSPLGFSYVLGHIAGVVVSLFYLGNVVKNYFFWFLILLTLLTATEQRLSLEYILLSVTLFFMGQDKLWVQDELFKYEKRKKVLSLIFFFLLVLDIFHITFSERGSLVLWLPVFLSLYFKPLNKKNFLIYLLFGSALFFLNKLSTLLAFIASLRSKVVYVLSIFLLFGYFIVKQDVGRFLVKSFEPRIHISKSVWAGFLVKPLYGHGFGTFALDFPVYREHVNVLGGRVGEQIVHGHSLFNNFVFELGIIGFLMVTSFCYLIFINTPKAFLPFLIISICDSPLVNFNQYILAGILFLPFIGNLGILRLIFFEVKDLFFRNILFVLGFLLTIYILVTSLIGHYYYDSNKMEKAIFYDRNNPLYYFVKGANSLNVNSIQSEKDLLKAISLAPNVSFFHGFLGASQLANNKINNAKISLKKAMELDGLDGYWCLLYSYANYENKKIFDTYQKKAFKRNPEIRKYMTKGDISAPKFIGYSRHGDARLAGFYRRGEKVFFPLPVVE